MALEAIDPVHRLPLRYEEARRVAAFARRHWHPRAKVQFCSRCAKRHIVLPNGTLDPIDLKVLRLIACGLRASEISQDLEIKLRSVESRIEALRQHFNAISTPQLIAIVLTLGVISVADIIPEEAFR